MSDVDPGWDQIQSRLFIKLARQAYNSGKYVEAVNWFLQVPFRAPEAVTDVQDEMRGEREAWLEDFALAWDVRRSPLLDKYMLISAHAASVARVDQDVLRREPEQVGGSLLRPESGLHSSRIGRRE